MALFSNTLPVFCVWGAFSCLFLQHIIKTIQTGSISCSHFHVGIHAQPFLVQSEICHFRTVCHGQMQLPWFKLCFSAQTAGCHGSNCVFRLKLQDPAVNSLEDLPLREGAEFGPSGLTPESKVGLLFPS